MLMDQGPSRKHLGDAFKPDPNSSSFRRPVAEMNIASGCPLFVSQSLLETGSYIKDDTIFIKVGLTPDPWSMVPLNTTPAPSPVGPAHLLTSPPHSLSRPGHRRHV